MNKIIWLTGIPCSGKTTIAKALAKKINAEILDGDDIRKFMKNTDFSPEGREKHMLSVAEIAHRFSKYTNVIVALVSPIKSVRELIMDKYDVQMIWANASLEACEKRDVKGMYKKARAGEIKNFTGIDAPYEEPNNALNLDTENNSVDECLQIIMKRISYRPKIIGFDFDGVISEYDKFRGVDVLGDPIPEAIEAMQRLHEEGYKIIIFTTRIDTPFLREWLEENNVPFDSINRDITNLPHTSIKPIMDCIVDDRAVNFNWINNRLSADELIKQIKGVVYAPRKK